MAQIVNKNDAQIFERIYRTIDDIYILTEDFSVKENPKPMCIISFVATLKVLSQRLNNLSDKLYGNIALKVDKVITNAYEENTTK